MKYISLFLFLFIFALISSQEEANTTDSKVTDKKVSVVLSNLGVQRPPEELTSMIQNYSGFCSSSNLFMVMTSYNGVLTLGVTSPYSNTRVIKNFVRGLSEDGMKVKAYATEVIR